MKKKFHKTTPVLSLFVLLPLFLSSQQVRVPVTIPVQGGTFIMGNPNGHKDEIPAHKVTLSDFSIGKYEVTYAEFKCFIDATGYITEAEQPDSVRMKHGLSSKNVRNGSWKTYPNGKPVPLADTDKPVGNISWYDAMSYCRWLSEKTGTNYSLPTEAEWEFAALGGVKSKGFIYSGGNNPNDVAWYAGNSGYVYHRCGLKLGNELGIHDMSGNVREWCSDWYGEHYYKESPQYSPAGPERGHEKVLRGGGFGTQPSVLRVACRNAEIPYNSMLNIGFRVAIPGKQAEAPVPQTAPSNKDEGMFKTFEATGMVDIYGIYFNSGKATVKPESFPIIDQIVNFLNEHPALRVEIEGHTDNTGSDKTNMNLSQKRAENIMKEIVKKGIDPSRLEAKGYGSSRPIADNNTASGRTQNRRVTIKKL